MKRYLLHLKLGDFAPAQSTRTLTPEGFLLCKDARLGKAPQVRQYYAAEFNGIEGYTPDQVINVFSSADELFRPETIQSYQGVDVTDNHPPGNSINAATWKTHSIGTLFNVRRDVDYLIGDLLIKDSDVIQQIQSQERLELSLGYGAELHFITGTAPDGTPYQAEFKNFYGDHVALVKYGRCGGDCRIGDQNPNQPNPAEKTMQIIVNGIPFDVADNAALTAALKKDQDLLASLQQTVNSKLKIGDQEFSISELAAVQAVIDKVVADAKTNAEKVTTLEANQVTPEKLEALANERATVISDAKNSMQMSKRMGVLVSKLSVRLLLPKLAMQSLVQSWEQLRLSMLSLSKSTWCFVRLLQPVALKPRQTQLIVSLRVIAKIPHQQEGMVRHLHKNRAMTKQQLGKKIFKELINAA